MAARRLKTESVNIEPDGIGSVVRTDSVGLLRRLHELVVEHPDFEVIREPHAQAYCVRYVPNNLSERQEVPEVRALLNQLNAEIVEAVRRGGLNLVVPTSVDGRAAIHVSICSRETTEGDVEAAFEAVARWGRLLSKAHLVRRVEPETTEVM